MAEGFDMWIWRRLKLDETICIIEALRSVGEVQRILAIIKNWKKKCTGHVQRRGILYWRSSEVIITAFKNK